MTVWDKDALSAPHSEREMGQIEGDGVITIRDSWPAPDGADAPVSDDARAMDIDEDLLNEQCWDFIKWIGDTGSSLSGYAFNDLKGTVRRLITDHVNRSTVSAVPAGRLEASRHEDGTLCISVPGGEIDVYSDGRAAWRINGESGSGRATPAAQVTGGVEVKPLVWFQRDDHHWAAEGVGGMFYIQEYVGRRTPFTVRADALGEGDFPTLEAAKAAAQANYGARIRAALTGGAA